jgi:hypothetical protein
MRPHSKDTILCHCDTCKVLSGSAFTLNAIVPRENFKLTKGNLKAYTYSGDSGKSVNCYYCKIRFLYTASTHYLRLHRIRAQET